MKHIEIIYKNDSYEIEVNENDIIHNIVKDLYYNIIKSVNNLSLVEKMYVETMINIKNYKVNDKLNNNVNKDAIIKYLVTSTFYLTI
jgi:hypothetical protein